MSDRFAKFDRLLGLIQALAETTDGLTLDDMADHLAMGRRTAERLRDLIALHFDLDFKLDGRRKRFLIRDGLKRHYVRPVPAELAALETEIDGHRAGGNEPTAVLLAADADQFGGERLGGFVGPAREDQLVEPFRLGADRGHDARVGVAVGGDPPAGDRVDPVVTVGVVETGAFAAGDQRDRVAQAVLGEGVPDGGLVGGHGLGLTQLRHPGEGRDLIGAVKFDGEIPAFAGMTKS